MKVKYARFKRFLVVKIEKLILEILSKIRPSKKCFFNFLYTPPATQYQKKIVYFKLIAL